MNAENIIEKLGNGVLREAARKLSIPPMTLCNWRKSGTIPHWRQEHIRSVAVKNGVVL